MRPFKWLGVETIEVSVKEKSIAALGAAIAIYIVFLLSHYLLPSGSASVVIASMGASAVLLFAVPHGQLSQPWPLIGGHVVSATVGVISARAIIDPLVATAVAVGLSIGLMIQLRCIHPPGGATAFTAVMGGESIRELGFEYVLVPVAINAIVMLSLALVINYPFRWRRYPAIFAQRTADNQAAGDAISQEDHRNFVQAIRSLDSFVDISEEDLLYLTRLISNHMNSKDKRS